MTDSKYSEALLEEKFATIKEAMDDHFEAHTSVLKDIKDQTTKTNGRVSNLERWQSYVIGFCACVSILIIPILITFVLRAI